MTKRKMGELGKLSQFSGIKPKQEISQDSEPTNIESDSEVESKVQESESIDTSEVKTQNQELKQKKVSVQGVTKCGSLKLWNKSNY